MVLKFKPTFLQEHSFFIAYTQKIQKILSKLKGIFIPLSCVNYEGYKGASSAVEFGILCILTSHGEVGEKVKAGSALRRDHKDSEWVHLSTE